MDSSNHFSVSPKYSQFSWSGWDVLIKKIGQRLWFVLLCLKNLKIRDNLHSIQCSKLNVLVLFARIIRGNFTNAIFYLSKFRLYARESFFTPIFRGIIRHKMAIILTSSPHSTTVIPRQEPFYNVDQDYWKHIRILYS